MDMEPASKKPRFDTTDENEVSTFNSFIGTQVQGNLVVHGNLTTYQTIQVPTPETVTSFRLVDSPTPNFTGREDLLKEIHYLMEKCSKQIKYSDRIVVLHGLGGIGKSELARKYAEMYINDSDKTTFKNVAWIDAEQLSSVQCSFENLARKLQLSTENRDAEQIARSVYEHFSDHVVGTGLFIFDNAQQMNDLNKIFGIFKFLPTQLLDRLPLILIITRTNEWEIPKENLIRVKELSPEDSIELLTKRLDLTQEQQTSPEIMKALDKLATALQGFPLGLTLASSNIENTDWTDLKEEIDGYLGRMRVPEGGWVDDQKSSGLATKYDLIMSNVWRATFEKIQSTGETGEVALKLFHFMAYMSPDNITIQTVNEIFQFGFKAHPSNTNNKGYSILVKYSLIEIRKDPYLHNGQVYAFRVRIHRLVQHCAREKLEKEKNDLYLIRICEYLIQDETTHINCMFDIVHVQRYLSCRQWSPDLIPFSIIFISRLIQGYSLSEVAWDFIEELYTGLKEHNSVYLSYPIQNGDSEIRDRDRTANLFYLSIFYFVNQDRQKYLTSQVFIELGLEREIGVKLKDVFVSTTKLYYQHLLLSNSDASNGKDKNMADLIDQHSFQICSSVLTKRGRDIPFDQETRKEIDDALINLTVNGISCNGPRGRIETVGELYLLLQFYFQRYDDIDSTVLYLKAVLNIHLGLYSTLERNSNSKEDLELYWRSGELRCPLVYRDILGRFKDKRYAQWSKLFAESFMREDCCRILVDHLKFASTFTKTEYSAKDLFEMIFRLAYTYEWTERFFQTDSFMDNFFKYTKRLFQTGTEIQANTKDGHAEGQFWCILTWMGLFSRIMIYYDARNNFYWSVSSVSDEMYVILQQISCRNKDWWIDMNTFCWLQTDEKVEEMLNIFVRNYKQNPDSVQVKTASMMLQLIDATASHTTLLFDLFNISDD